MQGFCSRTLVVLTLAGLMMGCGSGVEDPNGQPGFTSAPLTPVANVDFETSPSGPLGAPWSVNQTGASAINVVKSSGHGQVLELHGSPTAGDFLTAVFPFSSSDPILHLQIDVKPAAGASFIFDVKGSGSSLSARRVRLQRSPGSDALVASTSGTSSLECGTLPSGVWSTVVVDIQAVESTHRFSVLINGLKTPCTLATTAMGAPFTGINVMDASNDGFGGDVQFDNLLAVSDAPPCTTGTPPTTVLDVDFNTTPLGALGAPWSVTPSSGPSTVRIVDSSGHGRALRLHGSTTSGNTVIAELPFSSTEPAITLDFAVRPAAGASFVFALGGTGGSLGARRIRLQRGPGSNALVAQTAGVGSASCGTLASGAWSTVELAVHTQRSLYTFDVRVNGASTACTAIVTEMGAPFTSVSVMDASNAGWGGDVEFDDVLGKARTESTCDSP